MYARGAKFSDTSCLWVIGNVKNTCFRCGNLHMSCQLDVRRAIFFSSVWFLELVPLSLNCWFSLFCFCVYCFSIFIFKWKKCKIHWETRVKMREGLFVLVFAVFCSGCEPSRILIVRGFCVFCLHFFVIMFCLQVNVPQRSITHLRKCTWTLLPHPTHKRTPTPCVT
jgi:hypothetical protein